MKLNHLSDYEVVEYLDKFSEDYAVRRLLQILNTSNVIIDDLIREGMDKNSHTFFKDGLDNTPAEQIRALQNDIEWRDREIHDLQYETEQLKDKVKSLQSRSVAELVASLHNEISIVDRQLIHEKNTTKQAIKDKEAALDKLKVWTILKDPVPDYR